jgi:hypothetical protein
VLVVPVLHPSEKEKKKKIPPRDKKERNKQKQCRKNAMPVSQELS